MCQTPNPNMPPPPTPSQGTSGAKVALGIFLGFVAMCGCCGLINMSGNKATQMISSQPPAGEIKITNPSAPSLTFQERVKQASPKENLENGKRLLKNKPSREQAYQASTHLDAILPNAPEYKEAQQLYKKSQAIEEIYRQKDKQELKRQQQLEAAQSAKTTQQAKQLQPRRRSSIYHWGPRGGCYYINSHGNKTYVDHSLCR